MWPIAGGVREQGFTLPGFTVFYPYKETVMGIIPPHPRAAGEKKGNKQWQKKLYFLSLARWTSGKPVNANLREILSRFPGTGWKLPGGGVRQFTTYGRDWSMVIFLTIYTPAGLQKVRLTEQ